MKIKKITDSNKVEFLSAFLNDHFHNHSEVSLEFYKLVAQYSEFNFSGVAYRAIICSPEAFNKNLNLHVYKSWSKNKDGINSFINHEIIDGRFFDEDIVFLLKSEIIGIDIGKIISFLRVQGLDEDFFKTIEKENEILCLEITSSIKTKIMKLNK